MEYKKGIDISSIKELDMFIIGIEFNYIKNFENVKCIYISINLGYIEIRIGKFVI